eukprot:ctg_1452.g334
MVGSASFKRWQEGVVDVDGAVGVPLAVAPAQNLHVSGERHGVDGVLVEQQLFDAPLCLLGTQFVRVHKVKVDAEH